MSNDKASWGDFLRDGGLTLWVLTGGVALQAIEAFIGSTLLPSAVAEIGGIELFAWNTTLFIVASIIAAIFAAVRPFGLTLRGNYLLAASTFAAGSLICGLAPNMPVMLVGRAVQGFGGGLLTAMSYAMISVGFAERHWGRAFAMISSVWGVATLVGPAIGGVFASVDAWRWAFFILVPIAAGLGILSLRVVPNRSDDTAKTGFPIIQILLMVGAVLCVSVASILTDATVLSAVLVGLALLAVIALGVLDNRSGTRLFPRGTFSLGSALPALFAGMLLLNVAIISDIFIPLFMQGLHGQTPLIAGYMVALVAVGWSSGSMIVSSWTGARARFVLGLGPVLQLLGAIGLALFVGRDNTAGELMPLLPVGISLVLLGTGIGISWPHVSTRLLQAAPDGERDLTSVSISMVQLFASGLGAAIAGVIVNASGLAASQSTATTINAANWLYGLFVIVPLLAIPIVWSIVRGERDVAGAKLPAE